MSLTNKIKNDKDFQKILKPILPQKDSFQTISTKKAFSNEYVCLAETELANSYQSSLVGIAFDYIARFKIAKEIANNQESAYINLVAIKSLKLLEGKIDSKIYIKLKKHYIKMLSIIIEDIHNSPFPMRDIMNFIHHKEEFDAYMLALKNMSKKKELYEINIKEVFSSAVFMAKLDHIYRSGIIPDDLEFLFDKPDKTIIDDLQDLYVLFNERFIKSGLVNEESLVMFNPSFGKLNSLAVGGADADIYIDGVLYELKTTKNTGYKWQDVAQLIGYYLLHLSAIEHEDDTSSTNELMINTLAFYKARYGEIEYFHINDLKATEILDSLKKLYKYFNWEYSNDFDEYYKKSIYDK